MRAYVLHVCMKSCFLKALFAEACGCVPVFARSSVYVHTHTHTSHDMHIPNNHDVFYNVKAVLGTPSFAASRQRESEFASKARTKGSIKSHRGKGDAREIRHAQQVRRTIYTTRSTDVHTHAHAPRH